MSHPELDPTPVRLAIDLGASSGRVIAGSIRDNRLHLEELHRFGNSAVRVHDSLQWNVLGLWDAILEGLAVAAKRYQRIESIGADTWGVDYVLLRPDSMQAGPVYSYRDWRTRGGIEKACQIVPADKLFDAAGLQFMEFNTLIQLMIDRATEPSALDIADGILLIGDYIHFLLTGVRGLEATNASTTQLLDPRDKTWRRDLIEAFDLPPKLFTPVIMPGTTLGNVSDSVKTRTGLDGEIPVIIPATHDTGSAVLAVPANDFAPSKPDWCYISCGTWSLMGVELAEPIISELCQALNFTNEGGAADSGRNSTRFLKNIGGLWVIQQIRHSLQRRGESLSFSEIVDAALTAEPLVTMVDPDDAGLVSPDDMVDAVENYVTRTKQTPFADHAAMFRATLEGLAMRYRVTLENLERLVGQPMKTIHIVGGGCQNELLCQMTADACNRTVIAGPVEATAIGNLMMQMIGAGELESVVAGRELICQSFDLKTFEPAADRSAWDQAYDRFKNLAKQ